MAEGIAIQRIERSYSIPSGAAADTIHWFNLRNAERVVSVQVGCASASAVGTVDVQIGGTTVLASVITPTADDVVEGTLSATDANRNGSCWRGSEHRTGRHLHLCASRGDYPEHGAEGCVMKFLSGKYLDASGAVKAAAGTVGAFTAIATGTAGYVQLRDGGAAGTIIYRVDTPANAGQSVHCWFPGDGLQFATSIYCELSNATASVGYE